MAKELRSDNSLYMKITTKRNDTFRGSFVLYENGSPYDFTGHTARMQVKNSESLDTHVLQFTTGANEIILGGNTGTVTFNVPYSIMNITPRNYVFDLEITGPNGVETIIYGDFEVTKDTTR